MATGGFNELLLQQHQYILQHQNQQRLMAMAAAAGVLQNANPATFNFPFLQGLTIKYLSLQKNILQQITNY